MNYHILYSRCRRTRERKSVVMHLQTILTQYLNRNWLKEIKKYTGIYLGRGNSQGWDRKYLIKPTTSSINSNFPTLMSTPGIYMRTLLQTMWLAEEATTEEIWIPSTSFPFSQKMNKKQNLWIQCIETLIEQILLRSCITLTKTRCSHRQQNKIILIEQT